MTTPAALQPHGPGAPAFGATDLSAVFPGDSEMARRCRALDWAATPLGPVAAWPPHLRTAAALVLGGGFAMVLHYGPQAVQLYNDACAPSLGPAHPGALGRPLFESFPESRAAVEPLHARVRRGETVTLADQAFPMVRDGVVRDVVWTFSYAPLRDEAGAVAGVLVTAVDMTARVADEARLRAAAARQAFLLALGDRLRPLADAEQVQYEAARLLGERLGASRVGYAELEPDDAHVVVTHHYADGVPSIAGRYRADDYGPALLQALRAGRPVVRPDVARDPTLTDAERSAHAALELGATVNVPLVKAGRLTAILFTHHRAARAWAPDELALLEAVAERTWDAVERARAEAALAGSEARFRTVQDASPLGFCIHRPIRDADGAVVDFVTPYINAAGARIVGQAPERVMTERLLAIWPAAGAEGIVADYARVLATGAPNVRELLYEHEELAAGLTLTAVRIGDATGGPGPDAEVGVTFTDVTARLRADRERARLLAETEAARAAADLERRRLRATLDQLPVGVHVAEAPSGRLVLDNAALRHIVGEMPASECVADYSAHYAGYRPGPGPDAERRLASEAWPLARALATGAPVADELVEVRRADGTRRLVSISATPVRDAEGRVVGGVAAVADVTERERLLAAARAAAEAERAARAEAEASNRTKSEFLAVMSHELRTPLNAIGGYAELIELGIHGPVTLAQRTALERIQRSQRHLLGLIAGVLDYSRVEAGAVTYRIVDVPVAEAVAEAEVLVAPQLRAKGLGYGWVGAPPGLAVRADREKLQQVLLNLLGNAVKFTDARDGVPGRVEVACSVEAAPGGEAAAGGRVHLHVRDTGAGIAPDALERVFEPFVQADQRLTRPHAGVGLGLAISRDLARGMGGDLTAESTPDVGSTFTLTLPAA